MNSKEPIGDRECYGGGLVVIKVLASKVKWKGRVENPQDPEQNANVYQILKSSKQPIRTRYFDHVTGYQPIGDQYFMVRSVPDILPKSVHSVVGIPNKVISGWSRFKNSAT